MSSKIENITYEDGTVVWYLNKMIHREDGPAVIYPDGTKIWYQYNKRHRSNGPAIESFDYEEWHYQGKLHREDGPAIQDFKNKYCRWFLLDEEYSEKEWSRMKKLIHIV